MTETDANCPMKHKDWNYVPSEFIALKRPLKQYCSSPGFCERRMLTTDSRLPQNSVEFLTTASLPMPGDRTHIHFAPQVSGASAIGQHL